jgi:hypothetical protein
LSAGANRSPNGAADSDGPSRKIAGRVERVVEEREELSLQRRLEIDEQIAAGEQVEARERRVRGDVLPREDAQVAHRLRDLEVPVHADEEPAAALRRHVEQRGLGYKAWRAWSTACSETSVAKTCASTGRLGSIASTRQIAREYASSPVAQPGTQMRTGWSRGRSRRILGKTFEERNENVAGSRKNEVTEIRKSS